jgi:hypothetical protein
VSDGCAELRRDERAQAGEADEFERTASRMKNA